MTTLITLLISLLGYGTPSDFSNMTEAELNTQIENAQLSNDGGINGDWETPGVTSTSDGGINGDWETPG